LLLDNLGARGAEVLRDGAKGRSFGFDGEALAIMKRRVQARRLDCPLIFHRAGRAMGPFGDLWRSAVKAAGLPPGRLFHDLRRSAVRNLIRSGVDQTAAMKVSGHRTDSMFRRYNIVEESETAAAPVARRRTLGRVRRFQLRARLACPVTPFHRAPLKFRS